MLIIPCQDYSFQHFSAVSNYCFTRVNSRVLSSLQSVLTTSDGVEIVDYFYSSRLLHNQLSFLYDVRLRRDADNDYRRLILACLHDNPKQIVIAGNDNHFERDLLIKSGAVFEVIS